MTDIRKYNPCYHIPGKSDRSAMPLGNGETAVSVWMTDKGKLQFYISRTDAITELERTVKLGMVELEFGTSFLKGQNFRQEICLDLGRIVIDSGDNHLEIWVDKESDVIYVEGETYTKEGVNARYYTWRQESYVPESSPVYSTGLPEMADRVEERDGATVFFHKNGRNGLEYLARLQCVDDVTALQDVVSNRIFGGIMKIEQEIQNGRNSFVLKIAVHSAQVKTEEEWYRATALIMKNAPSPEVSQKRTQRFWETYWGKSYIYVQGDERQIPQCLPSISAYATEPMECSETDSQVTRAYLLTKFMMACCQEGNFPMYYNGLLFNLCPGEEEHLGYSFGKAFTAAPKKDYPTKEINPDERSWCVEHLWQNLRLPYYALLAQGEFKSVKKMFQFYKGFWKLNRIRARRFYGAEGQHNTEMTLLCGLQSEQIYGTNRTGKPDGKADNRWGGSIDISPGLELLKLMLEYYRYTLEEDFIETDVLPYAKDLFQYIETRFPERCSGKIVISPLNSLETYFDTENPAPVVAGMWAVLEEILSLKGTGIDLSYFENLAEILPEIPKGDVNGREILLPASKYSEDRHNIEAPELYAVYPFGLSGKYIGGEEIASRTFQHAVNVGGQMKCFVLGDTPSAPSYSGWQYIGNVAAMLGLRDTCKEILENNCALQNPGTRFPAMWGPIYDAVPDTDHGANILNLLQLMVMQCHKEKIYLMPAIPLEWRIHMKLYAPYQTTVECEYENGRLKDLKVTPEERRKDVCFTWEEEVRGNVASRGREKERIE